jgi:predicted TIM-barrel fold metal-dependent hydrolase
MLFDIHVHCQEPRHPKLVRAGGLPRPTAKELIAMLDARGISRAAVMCAVSPEFRATLEPTEEVLRICSRFPTRLVPFCGLDPRFVANGAKADFRPLLAAYKEMGCRGVGEYFPNIPLDDPLNMNLFAQVEEAGLPLTFHLAPKAGDFYGCIDEPGLPRLERVLKAFPRLVFLGHSQPFWAEIGTNVLENGARASYPKGPVTPGRLVELMRRHPNLHGDLSANSGYNALTRDPAFGLRFLEEFQDRLYFATDIAVTPQETPIVGWFAKLRREQLVSSEAWEKIAWKNAARLLGP